MRASDAAGNLSGYSNTATATTPSGTPATITFKQINSAVPQTPQTTVNVSFGAAQSAGSLNVVAVGWFNTTAHVLSVTDSRGNNYVLAAGPDDAGSSRYAGDVLRGEHRGRVPIR